LAARHSEHGWKPPDALTRASAHDAGCPARAAFAVIWTGAAVAGVVGAALAAWLGGTVDVRTLLTVQGIGPILAAALFGLIGGAAPETRTPGPPAVPLTRSAARCDGGVSTDPSSPRSTP
jgi:hypothetical protein